MSKAVIRRDEPGLSPRRLAASLSSEQIIAAKMNIMSDLPSGFDVDRAAKEVRDVYEALGLQRKARIFQNRWLINADHNAIQTIIVTENTAYLLQIGFSEHANMRVVVEAKSQSNRREVAVVTTKYSKDRDGIVVQSRATHVGREKSWRISTRTTLLNQAGSYPEVTGGKLIPPSLITFHENARAPEELVNASFALMKEISISKK